LHIRCGDDIVDRLAAVVPGTVLGLVDPLCEGPLPTGMTGEELVCLRAQWLASRLGLEPADVTARLTEDAARLAEAGRYDELVLWFEHDLHDQVVLAFVLTRLRLLGLGGGLTGGLAGQRVSLVCIDRHPSVARFVGLGQLEGADLAALFAARQPVTHAAFDLAEVAWQALTAPDPAGLLALLGTECAALPFLPAALGRHLRQFPWRADGLALTEWLCLDVIDLGISRPEEVFRHVSAREPAPWLGDRMFYPWLSGLAAEPAPLLTISGGPWPDGAELALTGEGRAVLLGRAHAFDLRPLRRWVGGVYLGEEEPRWVWDANAETLVLV